MIKRLYLALGLLGATLISAQCGEIFDLGEKAEILVEKEQFVEALTAITAAQDLVWEQVPLTVQKAVLVSSDPAGFGIYEQRKDNQYKSGEAVVIYTEPVGFGYGQEGDLFTINMALDYELKSSGGESLAKQDGFSSWQISSHVKNREFMGKLTYNFNGIAPGNYIIATTIRDQNADSTFSFETPFQIVE
jgi:hypothetical protein